MTDKEIIKAIKSKIEGLIVKNKKWKAFEDVPKKRHQLIIEGQLLGELKHFIDTLPSKEESKFKVGDTIRRKDDGLEVEVIDVHNGVTTVRCEDWDRTIIDEEWELVKEPKKCLFTQDYYTEEDRKVLCEDCDEDCEYAKKVEPAEIDFEKELYKAFGQVKDFTLGMRIAKWFYDMGKNSQEPVSKDLEEAVNAYIGYAPEVDECSSVYGKRQAFKAGANWQKEQFEKNRLKHCNSISNEQAELEQGFIDQHLDKHQRMPTFLDAIEYGMKVQKQQDQSTIELAEDHAMLAGMEKMKEEMIKDAVDGVVEYRYSRSGKNLFDVGSRVLLDAAKYHVDDGDNVKLIIIKEG